MHISKPRICIIVPWFGNFPVWMPIFIRSVGKNPHLEYHIWTDDSSLNSNPLPPNLKIYPISFEDYCNKVSQQLNITFQTTDSRKICDLKPFLGIIHKEELTPFEFWGFGDIDLILGNTEKYLLPILDKIDVFSTHSTMISGHFCLLRNNEKYRNVCYKIKDWEAQIISKRQNAIDEAPFAYAIFKPLVYAKKIVFRLGGKSEKRLWQADRLIGWILRLFTPRRYHFKELHTTHCAMAPNVFKYAWSDTEWIYDGNEITGLNNHRSYFYLHFILLKYRKATHWQPLWPKDNFYHVDDANEDILITRDGIFNKKAD